MYVPLNMKHCFRGYDRTNSASIQPSPRLKLTLLTPSAPDFDLKVVVDFLIKK